MLVAQQTSMLDAMRESHAPACTCMSSTLVLHHALQFQPRCQTLALENEALATSDVVEGAASRFSFSGKSSPRNLLTSHPLHCITARHKLAADAGISLRPRALFKRALFKNKK